MAIASAFLFLGAAVLPWMSIVTAAVIRGLAFPVFGAQASLWDLGGASAPIALVSSVPLATGLLLLAAALTVLLRRRAAVLMCLVGLLLFFAETEDLFGVHTTGAALTVVAVGPGIPWAVAGLVAATGSFRSRSSSLADLLQGLRDPEALAAIGLFLAGVFLAIDAVDHASGGDPLAVFGNSPSEFILHGMFIGSTAALACVYLVRPVRFRGRTGSALLVLATVGLALDGLFHAASGQVVEFVGHTAAEIVAHVATYYGIALLVIPRFVLRRP